MPLDLSSDPPPTEPTTEPYDTAIWVMNASPPVEDAQWWGSDAVSKAGKSITSQTARIGVLVHLLVALVSGVYREYQVGAGFVGAAGGRASDVGSIGAKG